MWGIPIALYLFLAGVSAGAFAVASLVELRAAGDDGAGVGEAAGLLVRRIGAVVAVVALVVGTLFLVADARGGLSNPVAFFGLLTNWTSPMTWGVAIIVLTLVFEALATVRAFAGKRGHGALVAVGLVFAALLAVYTGVLLSASQPVPLWNSGALVVLFVASAFLSGSALVLLVARLAAGEAAEGVDQLIASYGKAFVAVGALEALALFAHLFAVAQVAPAGGATVASLLSGVYALPFWLGIVAVGIAVPLFAEVYAIKRQGSQAAAGGAVQLVGFAGIIVGAAVLRILVVVAAQATVISVL
ncbi:MAG: hypothetical protein E7Z99_01310 [Coriobacteriaceae bacterium]|nr:hypothetical protein [Coriobacteriaceae bacterium]